MKNKHIHPSAKSLALGLVAAAALAAGNSAQAALVFTLSEQLGGGVVATYSGSLQFVPSDASTSPSSIGDVVFPSEGSIQVGHTVSGHIVLPIIQPGGPASFGSGDIALPDGISSGDTAGFNASARTVLLPTGYVSGTTISGISRWINEFYSGDPATLANMGLTAGTYVWNTQSGAFSDTITLNITAIPEPSSAALVGLAALGYGLLRRRRVVKS